MHEIAFVWRRRARNTENAGRLDIYVHEGRLGLGRRCGGAFNMFAPLKVMGRLGQLVIFRGFPQLGDTPESGSCVYHDKQGAQANEVDQENQTNM